MISMMAVMMLVASPAAMVASHQGLRLMRPLKLNRRSVRLTLHLAPRSIPEKLVDRGLGAGSLINGLHDHGAIKRRARRAVRQQFAWYGSRHHDRMRRDAALHHFAGGAVYNLGRLSEIDPHRQDR